MRQQFVSQKKVANDVEVKKQRIDSQTLMARSMGYRLVVIQAIATLIVSILWLVFSSHVGAVGALLGGCAYVLPNLLFTWRLFAVAAKTKAPKRLAIALFTGEFAKLLISGVLVALIIVKLPFGVLPVITGFIGALFSLWLAPLFVNLEKKSG